MRKGNLTTKVGGFGEENYTHCWWCTHYYSQYEKQPGDSLPHPPTKKKKERDETELYMTLLFHSWVLTQRTPYPIIEISAHPCLLLFYLL